MIKELITNTSSILLVLNFICYFSKHKRYPLALKIFTLYLFLMTLIQLSSDLMAIYKMNNIFFAHYYFIGQFILLSLFFKQLLKNTFQKKALTFVLFIVLIALGIYYLLYPSNYYNFNIFETIITSVPLLVYSFFFFLQKIEDPDKKYIYIVSGFFLYLLCSTLLFTTGNITADIKKFIWHTNVILHIVYQVLIFVEWYKHFRKKDLVVIVDEKERKL